MERGLSKDLQGIIKMFFSKFRNKKTDGNGEQLEQEKRYEKLIEPSQKTYHVVDMCEQMIDAAREFEDAKSEYDKVSSYINDVKIVEGLGEKDKKIVAELASNVAKLNAARKEMLKTEQKISDSQFAQMQELEDDVPKSIKLLRTNEKYLNSINRDLKTLEGEKTAWEISKEDCKDEMRQLRRLAVLLTVVFAMAVVFCLVSSVVAEMDTSLMMVISAFIAVLVGAYIFLKYQDCQSEIQKCDVNRNYAITLENRVKIKYVNMKNAVDYACEKYHVKNADELEEVYGLYLEAVKEREKFRKTNDDLEYYNNELVKTLEKFNLYDEKIWVNYAKAIIDNKEMVELKHDLVARKQKLRGRMEYNLNAITELKRDILINKNQLGDRVEQVNTILKRVAELNMSIN